MLVALTTSILILLILKYLMREIIFIKKTSNATLMIETTPKNVNYRLRHISVNFHSYRNKINLSLHHILNKN